MDISGEQQMDISHDIAKTRISKDGQLVEKIKGNSAFFSVFSLEDFLPRNQSRTDSREKHADPP
jgi:hypothetical protein